jgi:hypothetical protein
MDLTPQQATQLQHLHKLGFELVAFPIYPNHVGIRRGDCAALLAPIDNGTFRLFGEPTYIVEGNLSAKITLDGRTFYVWKKQKLEATEFRRAELSAFTDALTEAMLPTL